MIVRALILGTAVTLAAFAGAAGTPNAPAPAAPAAATSYKVDPVHSSMIFRIKHMKTAPFYGRFNSVSGTVGFDDAKPEASSLEFEVKVDSIDTNHPKRDSDVKAPNFFDVAKYPTASFKSTAWKKTGENTFEVTGDLTLHGATKPVTVTLEKTGSGKGMGGVEIIGFDASFSFKRADFGITYMPDGLSDDVKIMAGIEARKSGG